MWYHHSREEEACGRSCYPHTQSAAGLALDGARATVAWSTSRRPTDARWPVGRAPSGRGAHLVQIDRALHRPVLTHLILRRGAQVRAADCLLLRAPAGRLARRPVPFLRRRDRVRMARRLHDHHPASHAPPPPPAAAHATASTDHSSPRHATPALATGASPGAVDLAQYGTLGLTGWAALQSRIHLRWVALYFSMKIPWKMMSFGPGCHSEIRV